MNVKTIVALLAVFCLFSCAPLGSGMKIEGDTLSCDYPRLSVQFNKKIADIRDLEKGTGWVITFTGGDPRPMVIKLIRVPPSGKRASFFSLRMIASNMNHYYLGDAKFGEKEWIKTAYYDGRNCLHCGYFTNKDNEFIFISIRNINLSRDDANIFNEYKKTMTMPQEGLAIINKQFAYFDEVAEIR